MNTGVHSRIYQKLSSIKGQKALVAITFLTAPVLMLIVFTYLPLAKMVQFSFYDMKYIGHRTFIGLKNYASVFQRDDIFSALKVSLFYAGGALLQIILSLLLADLFTNKLRHTAFIKGCIFFPYLISGVAVGYIFKFFFTRSYVLDTLLGFLGFQLENLPHWLSDTGVNNYMLAGTSVWRYTGQNMVFFIGAMMSINRDLYEAADLDGANSFQKFFYVTMPSIKTVLTLTLITSISGAISAFEPPYVITGGSFGTATYFFIMNKVAHVNQKVGLASAMAIVLLCIIGLVLLIQKLVSYYLLDEDDDGQTRYQKHRLRRKAGNRHE